MKFQSNITEADLYASLKNAHQTSKTIQRTLLRRRLFLILTNTAVFLWLISTYSFGLFLWLDAVLIGLGIVVILTVLLFPKIFLKQTWTIFKNGLKTSKNSESLGNQVIMFTKDKVQKKINGVTLEFPLAALDKYSETADHIFLYFSDLRSIIIHKHGQTKAGDLAKLLILLGKTVPKG